MIMDNNNNNNRRLVTLADIIIIIINPGECLHSFIHYQLRDDNLSSAGAGLRAVEGGCQPVLVGGQSVLVDTNLLSFSLVLACSF